MRLPPYWSRLKPYDRLAIIFFLLLNLGIGLFHQNIPRPRYQFFKYLTFAALIFVSVPHLERFSNPITRFLRRWYLIISITFIYWDVGLFIHLIFPGYFDHWIIAFETSLFGALPNVEVQKLVNPILTELMQLSYAIYWFTIPVGAGLLYAKKKYRLFDELLFFIMLTFFISYVFFIVIPVQGPRFNLSDILTTSYKGLFLTRYLRAFVASAGLQGGAFPSSHVAVAVVILMFMWRYEPGWGKRIFLPAVIALSLATVYGQYHYLTDVLAGLFLGVVIGWAGLVHSVKIGAGEEMQSPQHGSG